MFVAGSFSHKGEINTHCWPRWIHLAVTEITWSSWEKPVLFKRVIRPTCGNLNHVLMRKRRWFMWQHDTENKASKVETLLGRNPRPEEFLLNATPSLERKYGADIFPLTQPWPVRNYTPAVCVNVCVRMSVCTPCDNMENWNHCGGSVECSWFSSPC